MVRREVLLESCFRGALSLVGLLRVFLVVSIPLAVLGKRAWLLLLLDLCRLDESDFTLGPGSLVFPISCVSGMTTRMQLTSIGRNPPSANASQPSTTSRARIL